MNQPGAKEFRDFISKYNLLEYPLISHRYTRFQG
jgi:hypothetical protein